MKIIKILGIDLFIIAAIWGINLIIVKLTTMTMSDLFFFEFGFSLLASAATMGLSRREIRKVGRKTGNEAKEKARKTFLLTEKISFNFAVVAVIFFLLSSNFV